MLAADLHFHILHGLDDGPADLSESLELACERGFGVLIAHPERSADPALKDAAGLRRELQAGSLAQLNAHGAGSRQLRAAAAAGRGIRARRTVAA
jgi:tyrosine-protein phosphatase YwqE